MHHPGIGVAPQRSRCVARGQLSRRVALPRRALPAHLRDLGRAHPLGDRPERRTRLDRLQLLRVAHQHQLGPGFPHPRHQLIHHPRADHPGLVHHQNIARRQLVASLRPPVQPAVNGAALDPRSALQPLRRDARECCPLHLVAGRFPRHPRRTQHRALAGAGEPHHHRQVGLSGHVHERRPLLGPEPG